MRALAITVLSAVVLGHVPHVLAQSPCPANAREFSAERSEIVRLTRTGESSAVLKLLKDAYRLCPNDEDNAQELAAAELEAGDEDAAEVLLRDLLRQRNEPELHRLLGRSLAVRGDYKGAAAEYQIVATMDPTETSVFDFGTSLMKVNFNAATEVLQYGLKSYPTSIKMRIGLALAYYALDRPEMGARLLCDAAKIDPADVRPMEVLADTRVVPATVRSEATTRLEELHERYPKDGLVLFDFVMVRSGRWSGDDATTSEEFAGLLKEALALDPSLAEAWYQLALTYDKASLHEQEVAALRKAIANNARQERYHYRLAFALRATGDAAGFTSELATYAKLHEKAADVK